MEYFPLNLETLVRHHREKLKKFLEPQQILFLALEVAKGKGHVQLPHEAHIRINILF